jgi:hypothetical protein
MKTKTPLARDCGLALLKAPPRGHEEACSVPDCMRLLVFLNTELRNGWGLSLFNLTDFSMRKESGLFNLRLVL